MYSVAPLAQGWSTTTKRSSSGLASKWPARLPNTPADRGDTEPPRASKEADSPTAKPDTYASNQPLSSRFHRPATYQIEIHPKKRSDIFENLDSTDTIATNGCAVGGQFTGMVCLAQGTASRALRS